MWASLWVLYGTFTLLVAVIMGTRAIEARWDRDHEGAKWFAWGTLLSPLWPLAGAAMVLSLPLVVAYGLGQMFSIVLGRKRD